MNRRLRSWTFVLPKEGSTPAECEDAVGVDEAGRKFALADGATEAFDAGHWARRLTEAWVESEPAPLAAEEFRAWAAAQGEWLRDYWRGRRLPWYGEEKARGGSFAAFVGLRFESGGAGLGWRAVAVGDSCLVQLRAGRIQTAMPISSHLGFNSCPALVPSAAALQESALAQSLTTQAGVAEPGDVFLLLSDAVAAWLLELYETGRHTLAAEFDSLLAASENETLTRLLRRKRRERRLKDDDVAIVRVLVNDER
ncbi:MAG: hypothetical protein ACRD9R_06375 [Pyrinomonadaceae bacterium]